jgi:hypothetical protein
MNGLSGSDVDFVLEKLKVAIDQAWLNLESNSANEMIDIAETIKTMQRDSITKSEQATA